MKLSDLNPNDIQSISPPPSTKKGGMRLSDLDPSEIVDVAIPEEKGLLSKTLEGLDRYGAAPLRAAYGKAQDSMLKKGVPLDVVGAAKAAYDQFGDDPEKAPTAAQLVEQNPLGSVLNKQGFKESFATHPTAVGLRGLMAPFTGWDRSGEIVGEVPRVAAETLVAGETDPISYIPGAVIERPLVAAGKQVAKVAPGLVNRSAGAAEFFTGVPKESWKNYITRNKQVKDLEKTFGPQVQDAADSMREGWNKAIKARKDQLGLEIEQAVMAAPKKANISTDPILAELNNVKMGLNPNIPEHLAAMNEIDQHIQLVKSLGPEGKLTARDAFDLQKTLQGRGRKAYSVNGALFNPSHQSAKAARDAAALTRKSVNKAMPGVAKANEAFSALHDIDDTVRPSLLTPGKSNAGLMGAVGKIQNQDTVALRDLGDWLGKDLVGETRDFATYKHMQGLGADAADKTGKAVYRAMMGGLLGAGGGYASSDDAKIGLIAGGLAGSLGTNPKLWRGALDTAMGAKDIVKGVAGKGGLIEKGIESAGPTVEALKKRMKGAGNAAKEFIKDEEGSFSPEDLLNILKPGEENVFDLKKARGLVGEPKRGLLEPKDNPAGAFPDVRFSQANPDLGIKDKQFRSVIKKVSESDREFIDRLVQKSTKGEPFTEREADILRDIRRKANRSGDEHLSRLGDQLQGWNATYQPPTDPEETAHAVADILIRNKGSKIDQRDADFLADIAGKTQDEALIEKIESALSKENEKGLLTNLNIPKKRGRRPITAPEEGGTVTSIFQPREMERAAEVEEVTKPITAPKKTKEGGLLSLDTGYRPKGYTKLNQKSDPIESLIARYGSDKDAKKVEKAIRSSQKPENPSFVINPDVKGIGWTPNMNAKPTGVIGEPRILEPFVSEAKNLKNKAIEQLQWSDKKYGATKKLIEEHKATNMPLTINTSSDLIGHDDYIRALPGKTTVNMYLLPDNEHIGRILFPGNPSRKRQLIAIQSLRDAGVRVNAIEPTFDSLIEAAGGQGFIRKQLGMTPEEFSRATGLQMGGKGKPKKKR